MTIAIILNFIFFQALWLSCVVGAGAHGLHWLAIGAMLPLAVFTWFSPSRTSDTVVAAVALCAGLVIDNLWVGIGILSYPDTAFAPYWIALLWVGLGLTINHSMAFFRDRTWLGATIVGVFAPVTYLAGERFGAVTVDALALTPLISIAWFAVFLGLARIALRFANIPASNSYGGPRRDGLDV